MYAQPKRFFVRELLLFIIALGVVVVTAVATSIGGPLLTIMAILNLIFLVLMFAMFIISVTHFLKSLFQKENPHRFIHLLNMLFAFFVFGGFTAFYLILTIAGSIFLLPFLNA